MRGGWIGLIASAAAAISGSAQDRLNLAWPTANQAYAAGQELEAFIQPTESGLVESGLFGCVRTGGTQFHEGLDLKPVDRDARGEPTDEVFAVLDGVVRHVSRRAGLSSYGRYVVIEHANVLPAVYTLYAHLAEIDPEIEPGRRVVTAQRIGIMGHSAGGYTIPASRAHVHFEIGLRLTDDFQSWYDWRRFGSDNDHGVWNGMNLVGLDPLAFYNAFRERRVDTFDDFIKQTPPAVRVRVAVSGSPDFVRRHPSLLTTMMNPIDVAGWEVAFDVHGLPLAWTPLPATEMQGYRRNEVRVVWTDRPALDACRCKDLVRGRGNRVRADRDLQTNLQLLFGLRR